jgi:hypothetical protein
VKLQVSRVGESVDNANKRTSEPAIRKAAVRVAA